MRNPASSLANLHELLVILLRFNLTPMAHQECPLASRLLRFSQDYANAISQDDELISEACLEGSTEAPNVQSEYLSMARQPGWWHGITRPGCSSGGKSAARNPTDVRRRSEPPRISGSGNSGEPERPQGSNLTSIVAEFIPAAYFGSYIAAVWPRGSVAVTNIKNAAGPSAW